MSRFDRAYGLTRSVVIYHAIPWRQRRMRRLYTEFVSAGDLVFDIGAHVGNHVRCFASLGCRVVALEPQPDFAWLLRTLFARSPGISIVEAAVDETPGRASLSISDRTPTVTSLAAPWRDARAGDPDFSRVRWNRRLEIETTTIDALIERFGRPAFVKIDVEGAEPMVLAGLTREVPALSFEFLPRALDHVEACIARLSKLADYRFNWSPGESYRLAEPSWLGGDALLARLRSAEGQRRSGDIYVRTVDRSR
jgi:FkbM family methyltransferase